MEEMTENAASPNYSEKPVDLIQRSILSDSYISNVLPVSEKVEKFIPSHSPIKTFGLPRCNNPDENDTENIANQFTLDTTQLIDVEPFDENELMSRRTSFFELDDCVLLMQKLKVADTPARKPVPKKVLLEKFNNFTQILVSPETGEPKIADTSNTRDDAIDAAEDFESRPAFERMEEPSRTDSELWHDCKDASTIETTFCEESNDSEAAIQSSTQLDSSSRLNANSNQSPSKVQNDGVDVETEEIVDGGKTSDDVETGLRITDSPPLLKSSRRAIDWDNFDENSDPSVFSKPSSELCGKELEFEDSRPSGVESFDARVKERESVATTTTEDATDVIESAPMENADRSDSKVEDSGIVDDAMNLPSSPENLKRANDSDKVDENSDDSTPPSELCGDSEVVETAKVDESDRIMINDVFYKLIDKNATAGTNEVSESLTESSTIEQKDQTNECERSPNENVLNISDSKEGESDIENFQRMTDSPPLVRSTTRQIDWDNFDENSDPSAILSNTFKGSKEDAIETETSELSSDDKMDVVASCDEEGQNAEVITETGSNCEEQKVSELSVESSEVEIKVSIDDCQNTEEKMDKLNEIEIKVSINDCQNMEEKMDDSMSKVEDPEVDSEIFENATRITNSPPLVKSSYKVIDWDNFDENSDPSAISRKHFDDSKNQIQAMAKEIEGIKINDGASNADDNVTEENALESEASEPSIEAITIETKGQSEEFKRDSFEKNVLNSESKAEDSEPVESVPRITNSPALLKSSHRVIDWNNLDESSDPSNFFKSSTDLAFEKESVEENKTVASPTIMIENKAECRDNLSEENILDSPDGKVEGSNTVENMPKISDSPTLVKSSSRDSDKLDENSTPTPTTSKSHDDEDVEEQNIQTPPSLRSDQSKPSSSDTKGSRPQSLHPLVSISENESSMDSEFINAGDDFFMDSKEVFGNPANLDLLEKFGSKMFGASNLTRQSLYVKFDPLVTKAGTPEIERAKFPNSLISSNINSDDLILMGTPPPSKIPPRIISRVKIPSPKEIDKFFDSSPKMETQHEQIKQSSDEEVCKKMKEMELNFQAQLLMKDQKFDAMERELRAQLSEREKKFEAKEHELLAHLLDRDSVLETAEHEYLKREEELKQEINASNLKVENLDKEFRLVVNHCEEFSRQILADGVREKENFEKAKQELLKEKEQAIEDLQAVETSFADLHKRYEKLKTVTLNYQANEEVMKKCIEACRADLKTSETKRLALKKEASDKLNVANEEVMKLKKSLDNEKSILQATLRKSEMQVRSLEQSLEQKVKECNELTGICDELLARV